MKKIKTLLQARAFVSKVKTCLIFGSKKSTLPSLWDVVDLPDRVPGQKGWGKKIEAIWAWKNELPALFPDEIFYGKLPSGLAVLMDIDYLRTTHYQEHHRDVSGCSPLARKVFALIRSEPHTTTELRNAVSPSDAISKSKIESALVELQVTLNIVRSNAPNVKRDLWLPFSEQYPDIALE
jgi:hypothetical protein